jgi:2-phospho-L-lactate guanylyltransferase (CobY/MobA/RfbA family)
MTLESNKYGIVGRSRAIADVIDRIDLVSPTERDDMQERQAELVREHVNVEKRLKRLMDAIETGGEVASVLARIRRLEPNLIEDRLTEWPTAAPVPAN